MSFLLGCDRGQKTKPKIILAKFYLTILTFLSNYTNIFIYMKKNIGLAYIKVLSYDSLVNAYQKLIETFLN